MGRAVNLCGFTEAIGDVVDEPTGRSAAAPAAPPFRNVRRWLTVVLVVLSTVCWLSLRRISEWYA